MAIVFDPIKGTVLVVLLISFVALGALRDYYKEKLKKKKKNKK